MDQELIDAIYQRYPWATEATMEKVAQNMSGQNVSMAAIAAVLGKKDAAAIRDLESKAKKSKEEAHIAGEAAVTATKVAGGAMQKIISNSDPVNATAEISHEAAKILANAGIGLSNLGAGAGKVGTALKLGARHAGTPIVVGTGLGVIFAKLLGEQEKQARQLIDFGAVVSDTERWTNLRHATRDLGMGLKDFNDVMMEAKAFTVQAQGDAFTGSLRLAEFLKTVDQDKTFRDFGMGIQDQSRFIAQEVQTLYEMGEIANMDAAGKRRVIDSYTSANNLAMFAADSFGMQREEALRLRDEARTNVVLRTALLQNKTEIEEIYGKAASKNIADSAAAFKVLNTQFFGEDFAKTVDGIMGSFVGDIPFDQVASNNISSEMLATLSSVPGANEALMAMIEKIPTLDTNKERVDEFKKFFKLMFNASTKMTTGSPQLEALNTLIENVKTAAGAERFLLTDTDTLSSEFYAKLTDGADTSIEVMNSLMVAFQNAQELLTPGYDTMAYGFETLSSNLLKFGKGVAGAFDKMNPDTDNTDGERKSRFDEFYAEHLEKSMNKRLARINETNITSNVNMVAMQLDSLKAEEAFVAELLKTKLTPTYTDPESGEEMGGEAMTEDQIFALEQRELQLADDLIELKQYANLLNKKKIELIGQEEKIDG